MTAALPYGVRLVALRDEALSVDEALSAVEDDTTGGVTCFVGRVRDHDGGRGVTGLEYVAHPSAEMKLAEVCASVVAEHPGALLAAVHRVGKLAIGDAAVVVAASAAHRDLAFAASRALIDRLKAEVPIWKHQLFEDGDEEWVNSP
ncbi:MAG TPA: molybdenum cofactor biosynthesis protein MoaE [Nocardioides sp.]